MDTDTEQVNHASDVNKASDADKSRSLIGRILDWLTAGYPDGIPAVDRFPVIAVLKRRLSDDEIRQIVSALTAEGSPAMADGSITVDEVEEHIARVVREQPTDEEIRRVSARLAAGGWPLAGPGNDDPISSEASVG